MNRLADAVRLAETQGSLQELPPLRKVRTQLNGVKKAADPSEHGSPWHADLIEVEPCVLRAEAVEISPGWVLSEDELQLYLPVLRLPVGIVTLAGLGDGKLSAEGQCRLVAVPAPPTPFGDEAVAVVLGSLDIRPASESSGCTTPATAARPCSPQPVSLPPW